MENVIQVDFRIPVKDEPQIVGYYDEVLEKESHVADPITDVDVIADISEYFIERGKLRDNLIFVFGCNCGPRVSEIINLKWGQLIKPTGEVKDKVVFTEEKTSKKDKTTGEIIVRKTREVYLCDAVKEAIYLYMRSKDSIDIDDFVFKSESNSAAYYSRLRSEGIGAKYDHLTRQSVDRMLKKTIKEVMGYFDMHVSTHTLRKTFARQVLMNCPEGEYHDRLLFLQKILGHAKIESTLHYLGIIAQEIEDTYKSLNLGVRRKEMLSRNDSIIKYDKDIYNVSKRRDVKCL